MSGHWARYASALIATSSAVPPQPRMSLTALASVPLADLETDSGSQAHALMMELRGEPLSSASTDVVASEEFSEVLLKTWGAAVAPVGVVSCTGRLPGLHRCISCTGVSPAPVML